MDIGKLLPKYSYIAGMHTLYIMMIVVNDTLRHNLKSIRIDEFEDS